MTAEWRLTPAFGAVDRGRARLRQIADQVLEEAKRNVPVESGTLRDSGSVTMLPPNTADVHFDAPYAVIVHERLDVHHATGSAKFLENAALEVAGRLESEIGKAVRL